jgi:2-dehydropantoate 2-reductase
LLFNNFWDDPQLAAAALPTPQLVWGFPAAGGGFQPDGHLSGALFPTVELGTFGTAPSTRAVVVEQVFRDTGFTVTEHRNFREWLWVHFAVSAAITAQQLRTGLSRRAIYENHDQALEQAVRMVREVIPVLAARGVTPAHHAELMFLNQPEQQVALLLGQRLQSPAFQAAIEGHAHPEELRRMFDDVLTESRRLGVAIPLFEAAAQGL